MMHYEMLYPPAQDLPSCHAATLVEVAPGRLLAAWFAGTHEDHPDVAIWAARHDGTHWSAPAKVVDEPGVPLWNPVLFRDAHGVVWLFFKVGPNVPSWSGLYLCSRDGGLTWTPPTLLPAGLLGPAKNKPITLSNGDILCPSSTESWRNWAAWVEISCDAGHTWARYGPLAAPGPAAAAEPPRCAPAHATCLPRDHYGVIQPAAWEYAPGRLRMLLRSTEAVGAVCVSDSADYGRTWTAPVATTLPNPNSGLDAIRLADGRIVLVCNPSTTGRTPLSVLVSADNGETWPWRRDLEAGAGEFSYPSLIQTSDGLLHIVYTHLRTGIRHVTLELQDDRGL